MFAERSGSISANGMTRVSCEGRRYGEMEGEMLRLGGGEGDQALSACMLCQPPYDYLSIIQPEAKAHA